MNKTVNDNNEIMDFKRTNKSSKRLVVYLELERKHMKDMCVKIQTT